jgi:endonuclease YncB( thermonuclease family)
LEVQDGDSELVKFIQTGSIGVVRTACIDTPELPHNAREKSLKDPIAVTQFKWANAAKNAASQWLKAATTISATIVDYDMRYGRNVAQISVDGEDLGRKLVAEGYAYTFPKYLDRCINATAMTEAQESAREQKLGIHSEPVMVPDEFRKAVAKMQ